MNAALSTQRGSPLPLGTTVRRGGINFAIYSKHATAVTLEIWRPSGEPLGRVQLDPIRHRTGDIWHVYVQALDPGVHYAYRMDRVPNEDPRIHRYDPDTPLLDPYTRVVAGGWDWGDASRAAISSRRSVVIEDDYDWGDDHPPGTPLADTVVYELHVRGFTRHGSSRVARPGTFAGLAEKVPYLRDLGITAVELMPVHEFEEVDTDRVNPLTGEPLLNFWGYSPICFFAPNSAYASVQRDGAEINEFRDMVKAFHAAGIEVWLDVVFNHTAEGDEHGPPFSFRGIDNSAYYVIGRRSGAYHNYSGCGNTVNCNHPAVRDLICECVRYWATEMHVDGFRFDLASILGRGPEGQVLLEPPVIERLASDPVLAGVKLIAEAWDAAGLYQVGTFPAWARWAEWNGKFRDDVRKFVKSDAGMVSALATRMVGSADIYEDDGRQPYHSINFITSHDGFTLADLVAYNEKHNEANGEDNRDGGNDNQSWNCGVEGATDSAEVNRLRRRQMKNFAAILLVSQGVPMILAGDEVGRSQRGNNNAYCQDNEISWFDWSLLETNAGLHRFVRKMIAFRKRHQLLRSIRFSDEASPSVHWHGARLGQPDWSFHSRSLAMQLTHGGDSVYFIFNSHWEAHDFELPRELSWRLVVNTANEPPSDIVEEAAAPTASRSILVEARSVVILARGA